MKPAVGIGHNESGSGVVHKAIDVGFSNDGSERGRLHFRAIFELTRGRYDVLNGLYKAQAAHVHQADSCGRGLLAWESLGQLIQVLGT